MNLSEVHDRDILAAQKALLEAVEGSNDKELLSARPIVTIFLKSNENSYSIKSNDETEIFFECIRQGQRAKGKRFLRRFFSGLTSILKKIITNKEYLGSSSTQKLNDLGLQDSSLDGGSIRSLYFMICCTLIINHYLDSLIDCKSNRNSSIQQKMIDDSMNVAVLLHDTIFSLDSCGKHGFKVQKKIALMCEKCWHVNVENRELLITQLVPFLLARSLDEKANKENLVRVYKIRNAFSCFDFEDETISNLRSLILRTTRLPLYLLNVEGRKVIAHLFQMHESLVNALFNAIKVQIPTAKKSILSSYGDIFLKAWNLSNYNMVIRTSIEENVLHDLVYCAIHLSSRTMCKSIREVLTPLHKAKAANEVDKLLYRLYSPILFRSFYAINPFIRINAAEILAATFPLYDHDCCQNEVGYFLQQSLNILNTLMTDHDPRVRVAGSSAASKILANYWDAIPSETIRSLLTCIITKHASDSASSVVRVSAISAVILLLDSPQYHAVLRPLLPALGNLIHDKVEKVRLAVIKLLLKVKKTKGIKFYHVVPLNHLLARLSIEVKVSSPVSREITKLLLNSYFPQGPKITGSDQVERTLAFLINSPDAATVFYRNISSHLSMNSILKLAVMLLKFLNASVHNAGINNDGKKQRRMILDKEENIKSPEKVNSRSPTKEANASNTQLMVIVSETISHLLNPIISLLKQNENRDCQNFFYNAFSEEMLINIYTYFESKASEMNTSSEKDFEVMKNCNRVNTQVLRWIGLIPSTLINRFSNLLIGNLNDFIQKNDIEKMILPYNELMILSLWGRIDEITLSLTECITAAFDRGTTTKTNNKTRKRKSTLNFNDSVHCLRDVSPETALQVFDKILKAENENNIDVRRLLLSSDAASSAVENSLFTSTIAADKLFSIIEQIDFTPNEADLSFVVNAFELYGRLALHKQAIKGERIEFNSQIRHFFSWISNNVVPYLMQKNEIECSPLKALNLSSIATDCSSENLSSELNISMMSTEQKINSFETKHNNNSNDESFSFLRRQSDSFNLELSETSIYANAIAISLLKSAISISSEWITVGGLGTEEILSNVCEWIKVLRRNHRDRNIREQLLPYFCKLTFQLATLNHSNGLLQGLLCTNYDVEEGSKEYEIIRKTIVSIMKVQKNKIENFIENIFSSRNILRDLDYSILPSSIEEICSGCSDVFSIAFSTLMSSCKHHAGVANFIVNKLNITECSEESLFLLITLYFIVNENKSNTNDEEKMKFALHKIDCHKFKEGTREIDIVNKIKVMSMIETHHMEKIS